MASDPPRVVVAGERSGVGRSVYGLPGTNDRNLDAGDGGMPGCGRADQACADDNQLETSHVLHPTPPCGQGPMIDA